uniref:Cysteine methyltransferase n=1 Tax=Saccharomyces cerevisiae TaxID=4932 RepID=CMT_YEASX|nr:RecName: Full=Cysteine methyltransferase; Short=CMT [Saccharomyces cerevisiae]AFN42196.3 cysteine methyltransferase [Saccharomyces cerevisiae]
MIHCKVQQWSPQYLRLPATGYEELTLTLNTSMLARMPEEEDQLFLVVGDSPSSTYVDWGEDCNSTRYPSYDHCTHKILYLGASAGTTRSKRLSATIGIRLSKGTGSNNVLGTPMYLLYNEMKTRIIESSK